MTQEYINDVSDLLDFDLNTLIDLSEIYEDEELLKSLNFDINS